MRSLRHFVAIPLAASCLLGGALVGPTANADPVAPPAAPADARLIRLQGTENTRVFSVYRTTDGVAISPRLIRSDNLSKLTPGDRRTLAGRGVSTVIDLRTLPERLLQPDQPIRGARRYDVDILGGDPASMTNLDNAYVAFVTDPQARAGFARTLRLISTTLASGRTALFHCTAGKDRTGWTAAMLLTIAGVDRATVDRDYLASNIYRHTSPRDLVQGVHLGWLRSSFAAADQHYGSFDGYLRRGLRLSDGEIAGLRNLLRTSR